ncbi:MAG: hypothetical protein ACK55Z_32155 [bacterium]
MDAHLPLRGAGAGPLPGRRPAAGLGARARPRRPHLRDAPIRAADLGDPAAGLQPALQPRRLDGPRRGVVQAPAPGGLGGRRHAGRRHGHAHVHG